MSPSETVQVSSNAHRFFERDLGKDKEILNQSELESSRASSSLGTEGCELK
jgi:hypothetical protein